MKGIINKNFLLQNKQAERLYHDYAAGLPIVDYHCHLPPQEIASNKHFTDLTEIWLKGDHYKWRAMRALGVREELITGAASNEEKFLAWAAAVPNTVRNPLFHWTQMELKNPFGVDAFLNSDSAPEIYAHCNALLAEPGFSVKGLLEHNRVVLIGTTDDPCDALQYHQQPEGQGNSFVVRPSFRPDPVLNIADKESFLAYKQRLELASGINITNMESLLSALQERVQHFHQHGCRISDHGLVQMPTLPASLSAVEKDFSTFLNRADFQIPDADAFAGYVLLHLCKFYHAKGWVQQFHLGAIRNLNSRLRSRLGADSGVDSIGDDAQAWRLARFLDALDSEDKLCRTILYNLNPSLNEVFAAMTGNFNDGSVAGKIQYGSAWWFLDQKDGIEMQLNTLSNLGVLSTFIGMTTDSRSFLSYSRHDYFRRILCNLLGQEMDQGTLPDDDQWMGSIVRKIAFSNARDYFSV